MERRTIYLIRHGDIGLAGERRYIGSTDLPLSALGIAQVKALREKLQGLEFSGVYCSDLSRSQQTAELLVAGGPLRPQIHQELREICMGTWENQGFAEIAKRYPAQYAARGKNLANYRTPGGESFADLQKRVVKFFEQLISHSTGDLLISGHAGVNRVLLCDLLGMPLSNLLKITQDYGCLNILTGSRLQGALKWNM